MLGSDTDAGSSSTVTSTSALDPGTSRPFQQPRINTALRQQAHEAYRKLIKSAYLIAANSQPLSSFRTVVQTQKANGVQLIEGYDTKDKCKEFVSYIADATRIKLADILNKSTAFSVLSDGSQARKTSSEKELVMFRTAKEGAPVYFLASLQNVDDYGDATALNLKTCIDQTFTNLELSEEKYTKLMVSATADGASVNTGAYHGLLVRLENAQRPWLLKIACISHRVELGIKDGLMQENALKDIKELMITLFYLKKKSGKFDSHFRRTASALGVQVYKFPKVHGTRFADHQRRGLRILLHNWVPLMITIENSVEHNAHRSISAKLRGILRKLANMSFLATACLFKVILDIIAHLSLKFEEGSIQPYEVAHAVDMAEMKLQELLEEAESPMAKVDRCIRTTETDGVFKISVDLPRPGHMRRLPQNREFVTVSYDRMTHVGRHAIDVQNLKRKVLPVIIKCLQERMKPFVTDPLYKNMLWVDPANWQNNSEVEVTAMEALADHFSTTLGFHGFQSSNIKKEWKSLKLMAKHFYAGVKAKDLWASILTCRKKEFPNVCMLVEIIMAVGISNCTVENAFSFLTAMLSDRRLSMKHETMDELLMIRANHLVWSENEREQILDCALVNFMEKRRKLKLSTKPGEEPPSKRSRQISESDDSSSEAESDSELLDSGSESDTDHDVDSDVETLLESWHTDTVAASDSEVESEVQVAPTTDSGYIKSTTNESMAPKKDTNFNSGELEALASGSSTTDTNTGHAEEAVPSSTGATPTDTSK